MAANPFAAAARARKVAALLAIIPAGSTPREREAVADTLAGFSPADRARFAAHAGVNAPSPETWSMLVDAVRARGTERRSA
jgi:hypothetical protein